MFQTNFEEEIKTHVLCSVTIFRNSYHLWDNVKKNIVERDKPQMTIWRTHILCWTSKATNTHTQVVWYSSLSHYKNGCTNAPYYYVLRTSRVLFNYVHNWM